MHLHVETWVCSPSHVQFWVIKGQCSLSLAQVTQKVPHPSLTPPSSQLSCHIEEVWLNMWLLFLFSEAAELKGDVPFEQVH